MLKDKISTGFELAAQISAPHDLVKDLRPYKPMVYYTEFTLTVLGVWGFWFLSVIIPNYLPTQWEWYFTALVQLLIVIPGGICLHRAVLYIHEISHMRAQRVKGFETYWNLLLGFPIGLPSYAGRAHLVHHDPQTFGSESDPEYKQGQSLLIGVFPGLFEWLYDLVACSIERAFALIIVLIRNALVVPISAVVPSVRRHLEQHLHKVSINDKVKEPFIDPTQRGRYLRLDLGAMIYAWGWIVLWGLQILPWQSFVCLAVLYGCQASLDRVRLAYFAHQYRKPASPAEFPTQLVDSINYVSSPLGSRLIGPVGLRFHALHHLYPYLPYHALPEAHQRLMAREDEIGQLYRRTLV